MDNLGLGKLITTDQHRDAIHIAVAPVTAAEALKPGQHVGFVQVGSADFVGASECPIGVVDPFLTEKVKKGERFWMYLYPGTITSLRHEWVHPSFEAVVGAEQAFGTNSRKWMQSYADEVGESVETVLEAGKDYLASGNDYCLSQDTPDRVYSDREEFWKHFEILTGIKVPGGNKEDTFFRCSC